MAAYRWNQPVSVTGLPRTVFPSRRGLARRRWFIVTVVSSDNREEAKSKLPETTLLHHLITPSPRAVVQPRTSNEGDGSRALPRVLPRTHQDRGERYARSGGHQSMTASLPASRPRSKTGSVAATDRVARPLPRGLVLLA